MNTEEKEVQETEYGNWRKFEIDEDEAICVEAGYKPFNELLNEEFIELENMQTSGCLSGIPTGFKSLDEGASVEFDVIQGEKGPQATNVTKL